MRSLNARCSFAAALAGIGLAALFSLSLSVPAFAQGGPPPGGFGGGPGAPPPDGFGGGQGAPPDGGGAGAGGTNANTFARPGGNAAQGNGAGGQNRTRFVTGTVTAVDADAGTLTLTPQNGGDAQTVQVGSGAQITVQQTISVSDLKVGDQIAVQGVPTGITASRLTVGEPQSPSPGGAAQGAGGGTGGGGTPSTPAGAAAPAAQSFAAATGTIKALPSQADPHLALTLSPDVVLYLKLSDGARLTRYAPLKLSDVKAGDRVLAAGQADAGGTLTASVVGVNLTLGGPAGGNARQASSAAPPPGAPAAN